MKVKIENGKKTKMSLAEAFPEIAKEWHPTKNGELTPEMVLPKSGKKVWWQCEHSHEWETTICNRTNGKGCPYCAGQKIWVGFNDLATTLPEIASEWHPTKNGTLTPQKVSKGYAKKVWWKCACGHEWKAFIYSRAKGARCPYCSGTRPISGVTDLATICPDITTEWHLTKNGDLTPDMVSAGSDKKIWWQCKYGHEWQATVKSRTSCKNGCPYCSGHRILSGFNDLATKYPDIATEWHPDKNGDLTPEMVAAGSNKKVWWMCEHGHEWQATLNSRTSMGTGCPYCSGNKVWIGFNDLKTTHPELIKEWHPTKNNSLIPEMVSAGSHKKVWWQCEHGHEWQATVADRTNGNNCPYCSGRRVLSGFNDLATKNPELIKEWHPTKNGSLTPEIVTTGSSKKVWWQCEYGHEWQATVADRTKGHNCPYCSKNGTSIPELTLLHYIRKYTDSDVIHRYRDLGFELDIYIPELKIGIEYDGELYHKNIKTDIDKNKKCLKNGIKLYRVREDKLSELKDSSVDYFYKYGDDTAFSAVISKLLSDISETEIKVNITEDFAEINDFIKYAKVEESLAKHNPELATEWHPTKNGSLTPEMVTVGSGKKVWWKCEHGHEWQAFICSRTKGIGCPYCSGRYPVKGKNDLQTVNPSLAKEWNYKKNNGLTPTDVLPNSAKKVWWQCEHGHEWKAIINGRTKGQGCPYCSGRRPVPGVTDLATTHSAIATQWHPDKNDKLTPEMITTHSGKKVWWQCTHCGHEYQRPVYMQTRKDSIPRCPHCKTPITAAKSA